MLDVSAVPCRVRTSYDDVDDTTKVLPEDRLALGMAIAQGAFVLHQSYLETDM